MNLAGNNFNLENANVCRALCETAYEDAPTITDRRTDTNLIILDGSPEIIIAFRGTASIRDWITDAEFFRRPFPCDYESACEVHDGFFQAFQSIYSPMVKYLAALKAAARPIYVTGHSLGAALAQLTGLNLSSAGFDVEQIYTFGCPRVGNKAFAEHYNRRLGARTFNLVNEGDPVPLVPTLALGYRDCGQELFLLRAGGVLRNPFIGFELVTDVLNWSRSWRKLQLGAIPNHFLAEYGRRMNALPTNF